MGLINGEETKWPHCSGPHATIVEGEGRSDEDNMGRRKSWMLILLKFILLELV